MNKFLRHKVKQIQQLNDSLIVGFTPQSVSDYYLNFLNNRDLNLRLRALRQLPGELLVSNNPEIAETILARDAAINLNAHTKLSLHGLHGAYITPPPVWSGSRAMQQPDAFTEVSTTALLENLRKQKAGLTPKVVVDVIDLSTEDTEPVLETEPLPATEAANQLLQKQLELRKQKKAEYKALADKVATLTKARVEELVNTNPMAAKQVRKFLSIRAKLTPALTFTFTEDNSTPVSQFLEDWVKLINKG